VTAAGWLATIAEIGLGFALLVGFRVRAAAAGSGLLRLAFALGMVMGDGDTLLMPHAARLAPHDVGRHDEA